MVIMKFWLVLIIISISLILAFLIFDKLTRKYVSPYTFDIVFGKKGVGKSLSMQKDLIKYNRLGWHCFADSNTHLDFVKIIDANKIDMYEFPPNSLITIDEVNLLWDNRDFKSFPKGVQKFFREQRKHKVKIIAYSQSFDCDLKLRTLSDRIAIQRKIFRVWTYRRYYYKRPEVIETSQTRDEAKIADNYKKISIFQHGIDITYIPKYCKMYDTNEIVKRNLDKRVDK